MHMKTLREVPNEAEIPSHILLLRTGMIRKLVSGVYGFMPLGIRSLRKIEEIVRQEMDAAGAGAAQPLQWEKVWGVRPRRRPGLPVRAVAQPGGPDRLWEQRAHPSGFIDGGCLPAAHPRGGSRPPADPPLGRVAVAVCIGLGPGHAPDGALPEL